MRRGVRFLVGAAFVVHGLGRSGRVRSTTLKSTFDGLVYALMTGGAFGRRWPGS